MSIHALSWAWQQPVKDPASKLILLKLADQANDHGECWPARCTIADECGVSVATVKRRIAALAAAGLLDVEERRRDDGSQSSNLYRLRLTDPRVPVTRPPGLSSDPPPGSAVTRHEPKVEPTVELTSSLRSDVERAEPKTVDHRPVTYAEREAARAILEAFNRLAGSRFTESVWIPKVIMRVREHPELTIDEHSRIIAANLAHPWWRGRATPSVIYGSGEQFERSTIVVGSTAGRGMTPEEMETYGTVWGPGTGYITLAEAKAAGSLPVIEGR